MVEIFSTARAVRDFYLSFADTNTTLPKAITISEFESKAWFVDNGFVEATEDVRVLLMQEAINFDNFSKLHIPTNFMAFLKNSDYIFRFFEELSNEKVDFSALNQSDTYTEFSEHLLILEELYHRYIALLDEKKLYDKITLPKKATINIEYIKSLKKVRIHIEGFLSKFEQELIEVASSHCEIIILAPINKFNKKIKDWLSSFGVDIKHGKFNEINLKTKEVKIFSLIDKTKIINTKSFSTRVLQAGYVFEQIELMVKNGVNPDDIAVVLPDESFATILKELDTLGNLNFAMGTNMSHSIFSKKIQAILEIYKDNSIKNRLRVERLEIDQQFIKSQNIKFINGEALDFIKTLIDDSVDFGESRIIFEEIFLFEKFLDQLQKDLTFEEILTLFINRINKRNIDDVASGKITVVGILETRGAKYDGVIIVDFNDDLVPKRSSKDMFLSSKVRALSKLPSSEDRENLQRFFYDRVIKNARFVSISYVENEEKIASRFLKTYSTKENLIDENEYFKPLYFKQDTQEFFSCEDLVQEYNFFFRPLSSSRLKNFLDCPRRYYFYYIKKYKEATLPSQSAMPNDIGNILHQMLNELDMESINSADELKKRAKEFLNAKKGGNITLGLHLDIWLHKLEDLFRFEIKRKDDGWQIYAKEIELVSNFNGAELYGRVDRIDKKGDIFRLYDYKSGKVKVDQTLKSSQNSSNFQLEFYTLLCKDLSENVESFYYQLDGAKLISDSFFDEKMDILKNYINEFKNKTKFNFIKTEDLSKCIYCPFKTLCRGEV